MWLCNSKGNIHSMKRANKFIHGWSRFGERKKVKAFSRKQSYVFYHVYNQGSAV